MELLLIFTVLALASFTTLLFKNRVVIEVLSLISVTVTLIGSILIAMKVSLGTPYTLLNTFSVDAFSAIVMLIVSFLGFIVMAYSVPYLRQESADHIIGNKRAKQYYVLTNLFILAMLLAVTANNPILAWITIEATTLSTAFLISYYNKPSAMEAAWKYLIINSAGLLLGFFGTLLYFTSVKSGAGALSISWDVLRDNAMYIDPVVVKVAFIFVLIGYGVKIGFFPMHTWKPDVYSKTPAPVGALLSSALLSVGFVILLKFKSITDITLGEGFTNQLLMVFGTLSIAVAAFVVYAAKNYKRLLAYSSIEQAGVIAIGFSLGGFAIFAATLHLIYHALVKSSLFLLAGNILLRFHSSKIQNVTGMITAIPRTSILFTIGLVAVIGIPPFGIFLTKFYILSEGIITHPFVTGLIILFVTILAVGFFKSVISMLFGEKPESVSVEKENIWLLIPPAVMLLTFFILSIYLPPFINTLLNQVASI